MEYNRPPYDDDEEPTQLPPSGSDYPPQRRDPYGGGGYPQQPPPRPGQFQPPPPQDDRTRLPDRLQGRGSAPGGMPYQAARGSAGSFYNEHTMIDTTGQEPNTEPLAYLFIKEPRPRFGRYFVVRDNATIGRAPHHQLRLDDPRVSDPHGRLRLEKDPDTGNPAFVLYDFGSINHTYVNGERVMGMVVLRENDHIKIGGYLFVFKALMD